MLEHNVSKPLWADAVFPNSVSSCFWDSPINCSLNGYFTPGARSTSEFAAALQGRSCGGITIVLSAWSCFYNRLAFNITLKVLWKYVFWLMVLQWHWICCVIFMLCVHACVWLHRGTPHLVHAHAWGLQRCGWRWMVYARCRLSTSTWRTLPLASQTTTFPSYTSTQAGDCIAPSGVCMLRHDKITTSACCYPPPVELV